MDTVYVKSVLSEINHVKNDSSLCVTEALISYYDKADMIIQESGYDITCGEFIQESFTKPKKNERIITKVVLAIPRFIYKMIKSIVDGITKLTRKKKPATVHMTQETFDKTINIIDRMSKDQDIRRLMTGAIVGTTAVVGTFLKKRYEAAKKAVNSIGERYSEYKQYQTDKAYNRGQFEKAKADSQNKIKEMVAVTTKDDEIAVILGTDIEGIAKQGIPTFLEEISRRIHNIQAGDLTSKSKYTKELDEAIFAIENNPYLFTAWLYPDWYNKRAYSFSKYREEYEAFKTSDFSNTIKAKSEEITNTITAGFKRFAKNEEQANKKEEAYKEEATTYSMKILNIINARISYILSYLDELDKLVVSSYDELIKHAKSEKKDYKEYHKKKREMLYYDNPEMDPDHDKEEDKEDDKENKKDKEKKNDSSDSSDKAGDDDKSNNTDQQKADTKTDSLNINDQDQIRKKISDQEN